MLNIHRQCLPRVSLLYIHVFIFIGRAILFTYLQFQRFQPKDANCCHLCGGMKFTRRHALHAHLQQQHSLNQVCIFRQMCVSLGARLRTFWNGKVCLVSSRLGCFALALGSSFSFRTHCGLCPHSVGPAMMSDLLLEHCVLII